MVLLLSPNYKSIIKISTSILLVVVTQIFMYSNSEAFSNRMLAHVYSKLGKLSLLNANENVIISICFIVVIAALFILRSYTLKYNQSQKLNIVTYMSLFAYGTLFSLILWHPQWIIYIILFQSFSTLHLINSNDLILVDTIGFVSYIAICTILFHGNVDQDMLKNGMLSSFFPDYQIELRSLFNGNLIKFYQSIFIAYMLYPISCIIFARLIKFKLREQ